MMTYRLEPLLKQVHKQSHQVAKLTMMWAHSLADGLSHGLLLMQAWMRSEISIGHSTGTLHRCGCQIRVALELL